MPKENGIGYGRYTALKIKHLKMIFEMHTAITQAVIKRNSYYQQYYRYIDLTSGRGSTPNDIQGSPLIFLSLVESNHADFSYQADFIERDQSNLSILKETIEKLKNDNGWQCQNVVYHLSNYKDQIPQLLPTENRNELGLVYVDHSGDLPDLDTLRYISQKRPRMEILLYIPATNIKRVNYLTNRTLSDYMKEIGKEYWLIRKPISGDSYQWTFLLGSSCDIFNNYKRINFLRIDSIEAQKFFPILNYTEKQREELLQPKLPGVLE